MPAPLAAEVQGQIPPILSGIADQALQRFAVCRRGQGMRATVTDADERKVAAAIGGNAGADDGAHDDRNDLGIALHMTRQYREAVSVFERILTETPDCLDALVNMAASLYELCDDQRSMTCAVRALCKLGDMEPRVVALLEQVRVRLPDVYQAAMQFATAPRQDLTAEERSRLLPKALNNFANSALRVGSLDLAEAAYALSHTLAPDEAVIVWNLTSLSLLRGDFERGFAQFESRWQWSGVTHFDRQLKKPEWRGGPVSGKRILVYAEHGFGDTIQFARFVPQLADRGVKVLFEVQQELFRVMKAAFQSDHRVEVIPRMPDQRGVYGDPPYDAHCGVMSLAQHLRLKLEDLPGQVPYITPDSGAVTRWADTLGRRRGPRIGLAWAGHPQKSRDRERSMSLSMFREALALPGVEWISLQVGPVREQIATCGAEIRDFGDRLHDFAETAALIASLDLVVSVDTSVAHLAGAMGKPVWVLLPLVSDWRWMLDRDDSPWYPTAQLFRQRQLGDWDGVLREVTVQLIGHWPALAPGPRARAREDARPEQTKPQKEACCSD